MYCICCKKNNVIPEIHSYTKESMRGVKEKVEEEDILWKDSKRSDGSLVNVNNEMIDNGIIHIIDAGYGSTHDGDQFIIAICDDCINVNKEDGTLLYYNNYMHYDEKFVEEEKEKSKKIYRRRKNLDGLV
jgi:hypothetical protein